MKNLRSASQGFNFTGSYKKKECSCNLEPCNFLRKRLCHRCFSDIHCNSCFPVIQCIIPCNQQPAWKYEILLQNVRHGHKTVQLYFNSPSEIQCTLWQSVQKKWISPRISFRKNNQKRNKSILYMKIWKNLFCDIRF